MDPHPKRRKKTITEPGRTPSAIVDLIANRKKIPYEILQNIKKFANDIICPMVLKLKIMTDEGDESSLTLYDPPSSAHTTGWNDGKLGNSFGCKLTNLSKEEKIQYVTSLIKLTRDAGQIISKGREFAVISLAIGEEIALDIFIIEETSIEYGFNIYLFNGLDISNPEILHDPIEVFGTIKNSEVKFNKKKREKRKLDYIADVLTKDYLSEGCKGTSYIHLKHFKIVYPNDEELKFKATLCIKRQI
jgi:hypothetical protein